VTGDVSEELDVWIWNAFYELLEFMYSPLNEE
jgi:hypothetical protein